MVYVCGMYMYIHIIVHVNIIFMKRHHLCTCMYMYVLPLRLVYVHVQVCSSPSQSFAYPGEHEDVIPAVIRPIGMDTPNWPPLHCCRNPLSICACDCHYYFLKLVSMGLV